MRILLIFIVLLLNSYLYSKDFIKGIDASYLDELLDNGAVFKENNLEKNIFDIYKDNGINYIRLRLWHTPKNDYCNLEHTIKIAKIVKAKNLNLLLAIHYSDTWADPAKQIIPKEWQNKNFVELKKEVYNYSEKIIKSFKENNTLPDIIQIGNEIENGFLWDYGHIKNFSNFVILLKQAINGIINNLNNAERDKVKIMIHISCSTDYNKCIWFYTNLNKEKVNYNLIGLSYYPWWHGSLKQLNESLENICNKLDKEIIIVETAYPWTLNWIDSKHNIIGEEKQLLPDYNATPLGQKKFLEDLFSIIKKYDKIKGLFYFAADYISTKSFYSDWENMALFNFNGDMLPALKLFLEIK